MQKTQGAALQPFTFFSRIEDYCQDWVAVNIVCCTLSAVVGDWVMDLHQGQMLMCSPF